VLNHPGPGPERLRLRGLDPRAEYRVTCWPAVDDASSRRNEGRRGGDELMAAGLVLDAEAAEVAARGDYWSRLFVLELVQPATRSTPA
ncbi:MAG: GH36 C-terminal domain-containing protein, partial [Candidatus Limnocylindrales bacterium]